ncbi:MAG: N-acetylmuramoyl-L-alanine amidase [Lachnospiraceae bacterium]|nr:N-acetylmuramoyl-L-alanine amidase [Lachnospiraceae bacterium]
MGIQLGKQNKNIKSMETELNTLRTEASNNQSQTPVSTPKPTDTPMPTPTETPIPTPTSTPTPEPERYLVFVDPGHGGNSSTGATLTVNGEVKRIEKEDTLKFAFALKKALEKLDIDVVMSREEDIKVENYDRATQANLAKADYFIAIHRNSYSDESVKGVEMWIHSDGPVADQEAAKKILNALEEVGITKNRGVKLGSVGGGEDYAINSQTEMPSGLLELGFITNSEDNWNLDMYTTEYATAIANAIKEWLIKYSDKKVQ